MRRTFSFIRTKTSARTSFASEAPATVQYGNPVQRDPLYYNTPLILLVETVLFKLPRSYFEKHLDVFTGVYLLGPHGEQVSDGFTNERPLRLDGVAAAEFRFFLKAMIQEDSEKDMTWIQWTSVLKLSQMWYMTLIQDLALQKISTRIRKSNEWIAALKIATQLKMQVLRTIAIEKLTGKLSPIQKIELGIGCSIQPWLIEGYRELVMRADGISAEEEQQLGVRRTSNLFRLRHRRLEDATSQGGILLDIQTTFQSEISNIAAFDCSPISYLRPELRTLVDPDAIRLDEMYYCVNIILRVQNTLFKLPRYLLEESSEIFRDMFLLPTTEGVSCDGSSDEQPLILEGVRKEHFRLLLKAMKFPVEFASSAMRRAHEEPMLWNEWAAVLELSCMWQMVSIREIAVKKILEMGVLPHQQQYLLELSTKLEIVEIRENTIQVLSRVLRPVKWIQLGIQLKVDSWLLEGYRELIQARGGISMEDEEILGWGTTVKLFRIREEYLKMGTQRHRSPTYLNDFATNKIKEVFAEELKDAAWRTSR